MVMPSPEQARPSRPAAIAVALGRTGALGLLSEAVRQRIALAGSPVTLEAGEFLAQAGDLGDALFVVVEGEIEVLGRSEGGRQVRLASLTRGAVAGEMAALDGGVRSADMIAARRSQLWRIPRAAVLDALRAEPDAALALVAELSRRLRAANEMIESAAFLDLGGRLAKLLLEAAGPGRVVALTQTEIARRISASREKVNRKLHAWANDGWVALSPQGIRLLKPESLRALIEALRQR
jgi:CRP/FNR family transcriptional regulator, cyclic AMP receptor protein